MLKTRKTADLNGHIAAELFAKMNPEVEYIPNHTSGVYGILVTDVNPHYLTYPEGWYFAKGSYRNKHNSSTGVYYEIPMLKSDGSLW